MRNSLLVLARLRLRRRSPHRWLWNPKTRLIRLAFGFHRQLVAAFLLAGAPIAEAAPRELSAAEREAVALAAAYLSEGPEAWWQRLADDAPLRKLDRQTALAALEVRAGPPKGAHWRLQAVRQTAAANTAVFTIEFPSGMEETLFMRLRSTGSGWRIRDLRMSSEPHRNAPRRSESPTESDPLDGDTAPVPPSRAGAFDRVRGQILPGVLGGAAALLLILAIRRGVGFAVAGLAAGAGAAALLWWPPPEEPAAAVATVDPETGLAELLELRRALATADSEALPAALEKVPANGAAADAARLWQAQRALFDLDLNAVDATLQTFPSKPTVPQVERLRARLGFLRLSEVDTALAYERLLAIEVWNDALLFEAAQAFEILGFPDRAERYYRELERLGAREAEVYYARAGSAIYDRTVGRAERYFHEGWKLKPRTREAVMGHVLLAYLVEESAKLKELLDLDSPTDAIVPCGAASSQALDLPAEARGWLLGAFLSLEVGDGEIEVPNGCALAPAEVEVMDAGSWRERRENLMLVALPRLLAAVRSKGGLARPRLRQEIEDAVEALARRGRWDDVLDLTEGLETEIAGVPPKVVRQRAEALRRAGRRQAARDLLTALAASNVENRQVDPRTLYQLAELLVTDGQYDLAVKLMTKAHAQLPFEVEPRRIRQVRMEKRLANASAVYESEHFEVFYPYERSHFFAERVAEILEAERQRLQKWIPVSTGGKTEVFLLEFEEFRAGYGGNVEILGLFDGKIRVPFAEVNTFVPFVVSVLTHELAHAMITEATADRAPRWLQEGLAQHVEMPQGINPIAGYLSTGSLLSFPMIEAVLASFAAPRFVPVAYDEARWVLHFIESRYGVRGIHRLLKAFRDGLTTEEALARVTGKSIVEFDREVWDWCLHQAPDIWPSEIVHYDTYDTPVLIPDAYETYEEIDDG